MTLIVIYSLTPNAPSVTQYDAFKRVSASIAAYGTAQQSVSRNAYDALDRLVAQTNAMGVVRTYAYDAAGRLRQQRDAVGLPDESVTVFGYDARGSVTSVTDARSNTTHSVYDARGLQVTTVDAGGNPRYRVYDNRGNLVRAQEPGGRIVSQEVDAFGRVVRTVDGSAETTAEYDRLGRVHAQVDARGIRTETDYDEVGNVLRQTVAAGTTNAATTRYAYDDANRVVAITNASQNVVGFQYDAMGRLTNRVDELGHPTAYIYGDGVNLTATVRPDGTVVSNVYDALSRRTAVYADGTLQQAFAYDSASRMTQAVDYNAPGTGDDATVVLAYDALNRVVSETQNGLAVSRQYDRNGNLTQSTYPGGSVVKRTYDADNLLTNVRNGSESVTYAAYQYNTDSRLTQATYGSGVTETNGYDARQRLNSLAQSGSGVSIAYGLVRDANGNVTLSSDSSDISYTYVFDEHGRVERQQETAGLLRELMTYDKMGNWQAYSNHLTGAETRTINAGNQYTAINQQSLAHDENGNLTAWNSTGYRYDCLDRLVEVRTNGITVATYAYDALNRRVRKTQSAAVTIFIHDGQDVVEERVNGSLVREFIYGRGIDSPVAMLCGAATYYYLQDWRANIRTITDSAGAIVETYKYTLFGQTAIFNGQGLPISQSAIGNPYAFSGRRLDAETGLYHYRNRAYSPELGRFLQQDPAGYVDGMNLYAYAGNNPVRFRDPYGLSAYEGVVDSAVSDMIFGQMRYAKALEQARREERQRKIDTANNYYDLNFAPERVFLS